LKIYYWKSATGDSSLLHTHSGVIGKILNGEYNPNDLEKLRTSHAYPVYSFRLNRSDRLLFTTYKNCLNVLEFIEHHRYDKSRVLRCGLSAADFACLPVTGTLPTSEAVEAPPTFEADGSQLETIPLAYYNQQFMSLNGEQDSATVTPLPAVILGVAGTGKTLVALSRLSNSMQPGQHLLYVSQSPQLVEQIQRQWEHGFAIADGCEVAFSTYDTLFSGARTIVGNSEFTQWFSNLKADPTIVLDDASSAYAECFTCSGFNLEDYSALGVRQSRIEGKEAKEAFYTKIFTAYCSYLEQRHQFDPAFSSVPAPEEPVYDLIVVDEAQNLSLHQLCHLQSMTRDNAIVYCMDSQQNLFSGNPVRQKLTQIFHKRGITLHLAELNTAHRYTQNVAGALDTIKSMARIIQGGRLDKQEAVSTSLAPNDVGTFRLMNDSESLPEFIVERATTTEFAVITSPEFLKEAITKFNTNLVFTPAESIGQEFHTLVVYKLMSDNHSANIIPKILPLFKATQSAPVNLPKDKSTQPDTDIQTWINKFYVACSRAKNTLVIMQTLTSKQQPILSGFRDSGAIQSVALETDWNAAKNTQIKLGYTEVAKRIEAQIAEIAHNQAPQKPTAQEKTETNQSSAKPKKIKLTQKLSTPLSASPQFDTKVGAEAFKLLTEYIQQISKEKMKKFQKQLANPKLNINQTDEYGFTLFMLACRFDDTSIVEMLLVEKFKFSLNVNLQTQDGFTALMLACQTNRHAVVETLLKHRGQSLDVMLTTQKGNTALMLACHDGHHAIVNRLLKHCNSPLDIINHEAKNGFTALMLACQDGHLEVVNILLKHCNSPLEIINHQSKNGFTALMLACKNGHLEVVNILLKHCSSRSDIINLQSNDRFTALMLACQNGHLPVVKTLLENCCRCLDVKLANESGHTALMLACEKGHHAIVNVLLKHCESIINHRSRNNATALILACLVGHLPVVETLLENCRERLDFTVTISTGHTALMLACKMGHHAIVNVLLKHCESIINHQSKNKATALILACIGGYHEVVKTLLENCKDRRLINMVASDKTALMHACSGGTGSHIKCIEALLNNKMFLIEATEYLCYHADGEYTKTLLAIMLNKKQELFDVLTSQEHVEFRSPEAILNFQNNILGKPTHPINKILAPRQTQNRMFIGRDLKTELAEFMAELAPKSRTDNSVCS
jgi:ankyrin repeat protein